MAWWAAVSYPVYPGIRARRGDQRRCPTTRRSRFSFQGWSTLRLGRRTRRNALLWARVGTGPALRVGNRGALPGGKRVGSGGYWQVGAGDKGDASRGRGLRGGHLAFTTRCLDL